VRVALVSDIHGNLPALELVAAHDSVASADAVVCLGDVAGFGPDPAACIDFVAGRGWPVVEGNIDRGLREVPDIAEAQNDHHRRVIELLQWGRAQVGAAQLEALAAYEPTIELDDLLAFHGSPASFEQVLPPDMPEAELATHLTSRAQVHAGGHTHLPVARAVGSGWFVNPGSVGLARRTNPGGAGWALAPVADWAIVDLDAHGPTITLHRLPLDVAAIVAHARSVGMPHVDAWYEGWT
jgi:putative phosphoesterase